MAMLLAAAAVLQSRRKSLKGTIKLIFQPNEENVAGARAQIQDGILEEGKCGPSVDQIYGIHLKANQTTGTVVVKDGPLMAASDRFSISVKGSGGHGGMPAEGTDAILAASHLISQLHSIVSRNIEAVEPCVLSVCNIRGGDSYNIMPAEVVFGGTVRTFQESTQTRVQNRILDLCKGVERSFGVKIDFDYRKCCPCTDNNSPEHVQYVREATWAVVGKARTIVTPPVTGAEDMAEFLRLRPGCFFFVGANVSEGVPNVADTTQHHSPTFDIDERSLLIGASIYVHLVESLLRVDSLPSTTSRM